MRKLTTARRAAAAILAATLGTASLSLADGINYNFDSGSLGSSSSVSGNTFNLQPLNLTSSEWNGGNWWWYFQATGVNGTTPTFNMGQANYQGNTNASGTFQPYQNPGTPLMHVVYSYDGNTWHYFDNSSLSTSGSGTYTFSNNEPFTSNNVYIARAIPYPMSQVDSYVASIKGNQYVQPTASANANLVIGTTLGTAGGGYKDALGRTVASQNLYGFQITDTSVSNAGKEKIVLTAGNHCGETYGNYQLQGLTDFLLSSNPAAVALRQKAVFYVYPETDPEGRAQGYFRSDPQNPTGNHNRHWDNPTGYTDITDVEKAMQHDTGADVGGKVNYFFDFHSYGQRTASGPESTGYHIYDTNPSGTGLPSSTPFLNALNSLVLGSFGTTLGVDNGWDPTDNVGTTNNADFWSHISNTPGTYYNDNYTIGGLNAQLAFTAEVAEMDGMTQSGYEQVGADYGMALDQVLPADDMSVPLPSVAWMGLVLLGVWAGATGLARRRRHAIV